MTTLLRGTSIQKQWTAEELHCNACQWTYGRMIDSNSNVQIGSKNFLIQQNRVPNHVCQLSLRLCFGSNMSCCETRVSKFDCNLVLFNIDYVHFLFCLNLSRRMRQHNSHLCHFVRSLAGHHSLFFHHSAEHVHKPYMTSFPEAMRSSCQ